MRKRGEGRSSAPSVRSRRRRRRWWQGRTLPAPTHDNHEDEDQRDDRDRRDRSPNEASERRRPAGQLQVGLDVRADGRVMHDRSPAPETEAREEDEPDERVALLSNRPNPDT